MTITTFADAGDTYLMENTFTVYNSSTGLDVLTDPSTVELSYRRDGGAVTTLTYAAGEITRLSVGRFITQIALASAGRWFWRWKGTGTVPTASEGIIEVRRSAFV